MEGVETVIVQELLLYREYKRQLVKILNQLWQNEDSCHDKQVVILESRLSEMDYWLSCLSIYESFVITRHLIDSCAWTQIAYDYKRTFGGEDADEDAMFSIQNRAIDKIRRIVKAEETNGFDLPGF